MLFLKSEGFHSLSVPEWLDCLKISLIYQRLTSIGKLFKVQKERSKDSSERERERENEYVFGWFSKMLIDQKRYSLEVQKITCRKYLVIF
jgi:hypothetical protein